MARNLPRSTPTNTAHASSLIETLHPLDSDQAARRARFPRVAFAPERFLFTVVDDAARLPFSAAIKSTTFPFGALVLAIAGFSLPSFFLIKPKTRSRYASRYLELF